MTALSTTSAAYPWRPDETSFAAADVVPEALILQTATVAGAIEGDEPSLRVAYVDDADVDFFAEAAPIDEAPPTLAECTVHTGKIGQLIKVSNEQFRQEQTASQLASSVARSLIKRADQAYLSQVAPTPPNVTPPAGLTNISGVVNGGTVTDNLDVLVDLIAQLEADGATPTHIVLGPLGWAALRRIKAGTELTSSLLGAGTTDAAPMVLGLPVLTNRWLTGYSGMVLDRSAIVAAVGPVRVATSEHAAFGSDATMIRGDWRIGWNVVRPERIGKFAVDSGDGS